MKSRNIILGGGLSGLSACFHSKAVVYEKNMHIGGHAKSHINNKFVFDEGIHVLHTKNQYVLNLLKKLKVNLQVRKRSAWIVSHDSLTRFPFQANTFGLPANIIQDCLLGFIENKFTDRKKITNYKEWIYYMFGKGFADHFMLPYCKKFWGVNPEVLTTDWVNIRHPKPSLKEVITGALEDQKKGFGVNAFYQYPKKGGFGYIADRIANKCKDRICTNMEAVRIDVQNKQVEFSNKKIVHYDNLLSTLPLPELIKIITDAPKEVKKAVKKLKYNSFFVVNIAINRPNISDKNWIYYLEKKYTFIRVSFPSNQSKYSAPSGYSTLSVEIAYGNNNPLPASKKKLSDRVIKELIGINLINKNDKIVFLDTIDIKYGYVIFDKERQLAIKKIHAYLKKVNITPCGRYGLWAYLWSDEAILSGKKAAETIFK